MEENSISVCIPCIEKHIIFLPLCIENIYKQTKLPNEVIISVSNVKCEKTVRDYIETQLKKYTDLNIILAITTECKYAGENRNIAIAMSKCNIITLIDADDLMHYDRIKILNEIFASFPDCIGILHYFKENNMPDIEPRVFNQNSLDKYSYSTKFHFGHFSFRRKLFDEYQYSAKPRGQDLEYIAQIIPKYLKNIYVYKEPLTYYMSVNSSYYNKNLKSVIP